MTKDQIEAIIALHKNAVNNAKEAYKEAEDDCRENTFMDSGEADSYIKYVEGIEAVMDILDIPFPDWDFDDDEDDANMDFDDAMDILNGLELDDTAYDYYREALEGIHYGDQASHETHGYESLSDVIADARRCEETNASEDDDEEELTDEDYEGQFGSEMAIRICRANNIPLSDIEKYGSEAYWINDGINNLQDLYDINENFVIPTGDEELIRDYRKEILEEEE